MSHARTLRSPTTRSTLLSIAVMAVTGLLCCGNALHGAEYPVLAIGSSAPDFNLPGIDDKNHALAEYAGAKALVVIFTSNHCPTAQHYQKRIEELSDAYASKGVQLVAINPNNNSALTLDELAYSDVGDSLPEMKLRAEQIHITYPYLWDGETQSVSHLYGPRVTPHAFLFDAQRILRYEGRIDDNERTALVKIHDLSNAIDDVLAGRPIATPSTPTAGCSTKWLYKAGNVAVWKAKVAAEPVTLTLVDAAGLQALRKNEGGKLRLVNFWNTTCGPCVAELPDLVDVNLTYRDRGFELVTVTTNFPDEKDAALAVLKRKHCSATNLIFGTTDTYKLMAAFDPKWDGSTPYSMLLAPGGEVLFAANGTVDLLALKRAIVGYLNK